MTNSNPNLSQPVLSSAGSVLPPPGAKCAWLATDYGKLRYAIWTAEPASPTRGTVVLAHGLSEQIEKYHAVINKFLQRGFAVAMLDWRGHGRSATFPAAIGEDFSLFDADLALFMDKIVRVQLPSPYLGLGHSMGGCLMCCAAHDHPDWFKAIVLSAPMLGILAVKRKPYLRWLGRLLTYCPRAWLTALTSTAGKEQLTSDKERFDRFQEFIAAHPDLEHSYDFINWFNSANNRLAQMRTPGWFAHITTPLLVCIAAEDYLVDNEATICATEQIATANLVTITQAWHEILMEQDEIQVPFWEAVDIFFERYASTHTSSTSVP